MRGVLEMREPSQEDVRQAVAAVMLCWCGRMEYGLDDDSVHYLRLFPMEDFDSAPADLLAWFDSKAVK